MTAASPSSYDIIALAIAGVGVVLGAVSIGWNLAEFRLSGPRVKAHLMSGARGAGGLVSKRGVPDTYWRHVVEQGFTEPLVGVEVVNVGRIATEVQHFSCKVTGGFGYALPTYDLNPPLSFRLEAHTSQTLWLPAGEVFALARVVRDAGHVSGRISAWMSVEVTGPKTLRTESFPVVDGA